VTLNRGPMEFPGYSGHFPARFEAVSKTSGAYAADISVASEWIVELFDISGDIRSRDLTVLVDLFLDPLLLQATKEGFSYGIVPAIAASAYARFEMMRAAEAAPRVAPVL
jgi:hypothetical protein